jgi:hypothetical protein
VEHAAVKTGPGASTGNGNRFKAREGLVVIPREGVLVKASFRCFAFIKAALDVDLAAFGV